jgi:hypothetical protein
VSFFSHIKSVAESYTVPSPRSQNVPDVATQIVVVLLLVLVVVVVLVLVLVVVGGTTALHPASPTPVLHTSFAPLPPAISFHAQPLKSEQWQCSSAPFVTQ